MKILLYALTFSLLSAQVLANEAQLEQCEKEGRNFGNGQGRDYLPFECFNLFLSAANPAAIKKSNGGKFSAYGYRNIVFIKDPSARIGLQNIIAGSSTLITEVVALAIDEVNKEIAVLDKSGDILFFSSTITGNIAPKRVLKAKELDGAHDLVINSVRQEVIALNKQNHDLVVFSREANFFGVEGKKKLGLIRSVDGVNGEFLSIDPHHQELFMLNSSGDSILVFNLNSKSQNPVRKLNLPEKSVKRIDYSSESDEIKFIGAKGEVRISRIKKNI